jgi:acyl-CoA thioesterase
MPMGCLIDDDLEYELGDKNEKRIAAALYYRNSSTCPSATVSHSNLKQKISSKTIKHEMKIMKPFWLNNKIIYRTN